MNGIACWMNGRIELCGGWKLNRLNNDMQFIQLCENFDPSNEDLSMTTMELSQFLNEKGIPTKDKGTYLMIEGGGKYIIVEVLQAENIISDNEEEAESVNVGFGAYDVNQAVQELGDTAASGMRGMAGKLFRTDAQKAKAALNNRKKVAAKAVDAYNVATKRLEDALAQQQRQGATKLNY